MMKSKKDKAEINRQLDRLATYLLENQQFAAVIKSEKGKSSVDIAICLLDSLKIIIEKGYTPDSALREIQRLRSEISKHQENQVMADVAQNEDDTQIAELQVKILDLERRNKVLEDDLADAHGETNRLEDYLSTRFGDRLDDISGWENNSGKSVDAAIGVIAWLEKKYDDLERRNKNLEGDQTYHEEEADRLRRYMADNFEDDLKDNNPVNMAIRIIQRLMSERDALSDQLAVEENQGFKPSGEVLDRLDVLEKRATNHNRRLNKHAQWMRDPKGELLNRFSDLENRISELKGRVYEETPDDAWGSEVNERLDGLDKKNKASHAWAARTDGRLVAVEKWSVSHSGDQDRNHKQVDSRLDGLDNRVAGLKNRLDHETPGDAWGSEVDKRLCEVEKAIGGQSSENAYFHNTINAIKDLRLIDLAQESENPCAKGHDYRSVYPSHIGRAFFRCVRCGHVKPYSDVGM